MKLLICVSEYFPHGSGIANVVYNVVEQLKKQGVECTVCSPTGPDIILGNKPLIEKTGFLGLLYYWYQVSHFFKRTDYDAVWLQNPYFIGRNPFPSCLITMHSTYLGLSHHHVGNTFFLRMYNTISSILERYCLGKISKSTVFTGVGQAVCEELEKIGIAKEQIVHIPNGVDIRHFNRINDKKSLRQKFGFSTDDTILLNVGRLTSAKRPQTLINVFSLLEKRMLNLKLCIAGTGELLDSIKHMTINAGLKKVIFLGQVDYNWGLPDLYAASDYFIMMSVYEGGMPPLTLSEAMASGLPCIVSDIPSLRTVKEANCGIVVNFKATESAANEILEYVMGNHSDHAKNARDYAIQFLDWEIISKKYLKYFQTLQNSSDNCCIGQK